MKCETTINWAFGSKILNLCNPMYCAILCTVQSYVLCNPVYCAILCTVQSCPKSLLMYTVQSFFSLRKGTCRNESENVEMSLKN
jgi:hypothetical protein